jgi:hypothetical protein
MPLLTELCSFVDDNYKDAAPTALRTRSKERWTETGGQNKVAMQCEWQKSSSE